MTSLHSQLIIPLAANSTVFGCIFYCEQLLLARLFGLLNTIGAQNSLRPPLVVKLNLIVFTST